VDLDPALVDLIQLAIAEDMKFLEMLHNQETKDQLLESILASEI
jgi:hypothetical protein